MAVKRAVADSEFAGSPTVVFDGVDLFPVQSQPAGALRDRTRDRIAS